MRDRLVAVLVGMAVAIVALYGIPRAYVLADLVNEQETRKVERSADLMAVMLQERQSAGEPVNESFLTALLHDEEGLVYRSDAGREVRVGATNHGAGDLSVTRELGTGGSVELTRSGALISERVSQALLPLLVSGLGLVAIAAVVGWILARRFARPFGELATAAGQLGRGRFDLDLRTYSMPEAEEIAGALRLSAHQLDGLLTREREFAANASHQLRTPVTALRLSLEDLTMWPETPAEVANELHSGIAELDRLSGAVNELLGLSRGRALGEMSRIDLAEAAQEAVARWSAHYVERGRELRCAAHEEVEAFVVPGPVGQILDVLVENACAHGTGAVTVTAQEAGKYVALSVSDEGLVAIDHEVFNRGTQSKDSEGRGLGLTIASQLAVALGGYLTLTDEPTTTFRLVLPGLELRDGS